MVSAAETSRQREEIRKVYDSEGWRKKLNLMNARQVYAIYLRLKKRPNSNLV